MPTEQPPAPAGPVPLPGPVSATADPPAERTSAGAPAVSSPAATGRRPRSAGRNLPVAITVGLALGALIIGTLFTARPLFVLVLFAAVAIGLWELAQGLRRLRLRLPLVPLTAGGAAMLLAAYRGGTQGLLLAFLGTLVVLAGWRLPMHPRWYLGDVTAACFAAVYIPFLAAFAALLAAPADGARRVITFVVVTVCSDIGGYAAGVLTGRHLMAPTISPKKTWEGLAGSTVACLVAGALCMTLLLPGSLWQGLVLGLAVLASATVGDLGESMLKRDLGIKDMGTLLPGHGGLMDRLDSLLPAAPVAWVLITAFVGPH